MRVKTRAAKRSILKARCDRTIPCRVDILASATRFSALVCRMTDGPRVRWGCQYLTWVPDPGSVAMTEISYSVLAVGTVIRL